MSIHARAADLIRTLNLQPHPEGGFYREVFRSPSRVQTGDARGGRSAVTTIYFLLAAGQHSRWHRVASDEIWHWYEGEPLELLTVPPDFSRIERIVLGPVAHDRQPVYTVPATWWQAARPLGTFAFVGCTVAPGFEFADFEFLKDDAAALARLQKVAGKSLMDLV